MSPLIPISLKPGAPNPDRSEYPARKTAFPEAESLFKALSFVSEKGFVPSDVQGKNVMVRSGTGELVVVDVGLFDLRKK